MLPKEEPITKESVYKRQLEMEVRLTSKINVLSKENIQITKHFTALVIVVIILELTNIFVHIYF